MKLQDFIKNFVRPNTLIRLQYEAPGGHSEVPDGMAMEWKLKSGEFKDHEVIGVTDILYKVHADAVNLVIYPDAKTLIKKFKQNKNSTIMGTKPLAQKKVIKTISKAYRNELMERGFSIHPIQPGTMEIRSYDFRKNDTQVYIHEYANSVTFLAIHAKSKTEARLEMWSNRYEKARPFGGCGVTIIMEKMYRIALDILEPQS